MATILPVVSATVLVGGAACYAWGQYDRSVNPGDFPKDFPNAKEKYGKYATYTGAAGLVATVLCFVGKWFLSTKK